MNLFPQWAILQPERELSSSSTLYKKLDPVVSVNSIGVHHRRTWTNMAVKFPQNTTLKMCWHELSYIIQIMIGLLHPSMSNDYTVNCPMLKRIIYLMHCLNTWILSGAGQPETFCIIPSSLQCNSMINSPILCNCNEMHAKNLVKINFNVFQYIYIFKYHI